MHAITILVSQWLETIKEEVASQSVLKKIVVKISTNTLDSDKGKYEQGVFFINIKYNFILLQP